MNDGPSPEQLERLRELARAKAHLLELQRQARYCPQAPTERQAEFLSLGCREAFYGGAAGGGKSSALLMAALQYVHQPHYRAVLIRRTYADLSKPGALMDRAREWLRGTNATPQDGGKSWRFPSGAQILFGYLDSDADLTQYEGPEFHFIGVDEAGQIKPGHYKHLHSRLRKNKGDPIPLRFRAASNPGGIAHDFLFERFIQNPEGRVFVPARLEDNPHLDESYELSLKELDPVRYRQLRFGDWIRDDSQLVYRFDKSKNTAAALPVLPAGESWDYILGIDYGNVDDTALVVLAYTDHEDAIYVVESAKWPKLEPHGAALKVQEWRAKYNFVRIVADTGGLGKGYVEYARQRLALPIEPASKTEKRDYIGLLNGALHNRALRIITHSNEALIKELGALVWKDETQTKEHPSQPNHLCDALLYGWREAVRYWRFDPRPQLDAQTMQLDETMRRHRERLSNRGSQDWWER